MTIKYRYENVLKIKCLCETNELEYVVDVIKNTFNQFNNLITSNDLEYGKILLEQYISETLSNNKRLINFIEDICFSSDYSDEELFMIFQESIDFSRAIDVTGFREFVDLYLGNSTDYIYSEVLNKE